ncbi:unknown structural protein [Synechococcus phage S-CBS2]|uniref:unknown structural protein n=1 Tax=Synechococcus phage S-CBS2 TaxID=753084 RepID=UPI00020783EB|nr:unknown structural protein [Synechococcus phage S-CBS2]ADF42374.1 unknown structural protein [Synechococcus phage S-CBS2]
MAQNFPTSAQVIYDTLAADSSFLSLLGTYAFRSNNGATVPAISVVSPGESLPELRGVSGVECVIHDAANASRKDYLTNASSQVFTWQVFLICWDGSKGEDMMNALSVILSKFSGATSTETVAVSDGLGALAQTRIFIPSNMPIIA